MTISDDLIFLLLTGKNKSKKRFYHGRNSNSENGAAQVVKIQIAASVNDRRSARSACKKNEVSIHVLDCVFFRSTTVSLFFFFHFTTGVFLQERERLATDHINLVNQVLLSMLLCIALVFAESWIVILLFGASMQKQKQTEEEYSRKVQELQAELTSSRETQEALERKVRKILLFCEFIYSKIWSLWKF